MGFDILDTSPTREPDPPETPKDAYKAVVNGVLNHGCKTVTALGLDEQPKGKTGIHRTAVKEAGYHPGQDHRFIPGRSTPIDYCSESFIDIGLIGEEEIIEAQHPQMEGGTAYRLSSFGRDMQPVFAYAINQVAEAEELEDFSTILGRTESHAEERSPLRRSKILYSINEGAVDTSEVAEEQNISLDSVSGILARLDENDVLERVYPTQDGGGFYRLCPNHSSEDISRNGNYAPQAHQIVEALEGEDTINLEQAAEITGVYPTASNALTRLEERGVIERVPNFDLTQKGEEAVEILNGVANAVSSYMSQDTDDLEGALAVMPGYIMDTWEQYQEETERFRNSYNRAIWNSSRLNSPKVNRIEPEKARERVGRVVEDLDSPTVEEVKEEWDERFPETRSSKAIGKYLRDCENTQPLESSVNGEQEWEKS
jgi:Mn-dependent DtxR family transcriptional regulator